MYELLIDLTFEDEAHLNETLGRHETKLGAIKVESTSRQVGEVVTVKITGELLPIIEFLDDEWGGAQEEVILAIAEAIKEGRCNWDVSLTL